MVMLLCGINGWVFRERETGMIDYRYLAKTTGQSTSISSTYILFLTKLQKRQTTQNGFALIEKRYHNVFKASKTCRI